MKIEPKIRFSKKNHLIQELLLHISFSNKKTFPSFQLPQKQFFFTIEISVLMFSFDVQYIQLFFKIWISKNSDQLHKRIIIY